MVAEKLDPSDHPTQTKRQVRLNFSEVCRQQTTVTPPERGVQTETTEPGPGAATRDPGAPVAPFSARVEAGMSLAALRAHRAFKTPNRRRVVVSMRSGTSPGTVSAVTRTSSGPSSTSERSTCLASERSACLGKGRELGYAREPPTGCPTSLREEGYGGPKRRRRGTRGKGRACRTPRPVSMTRVAEDLMPGPRGGKLTPKPGH